MDLFQHITPQTTVLTPNRRLSAVLLKKYAQWQIEQGKSTWFTLDSLPLYPSWMERLWNNYLAENWAENSILLTTHQERLLWEAILKNIPENDSLLQISETANLAKKAWEILKRWGVSLNNPAFHLTEDSRAFLGWANEFQKRSRQNHWIDHSSLANVLTDKINLKFILPPAQIILIGFVEIPPAYQHLLETCSRFGSHIQQYHFQSRNKTTHTIKLKNIENEISTMARFAKSALTTSSSIGCIIPNLEKNRETVYKIFSAVLPEQNFNISAGKTLISYPIIHAALELLKINSNAISLDKCTTLLRTPFIGEAEREQNKRAIYLHYLQNLNSASLTLSEFSSELKNTCPDLATRLIKFQEKEKMSRKKIGPFHEWVTVFLELLDCLGWPGERSLNSHEYQVVQNSWLPLLNEFKNLDLVLESQNYETALHYLNCLVTQTVFQPESQEAPIQILGILEAAEIPFDHLWVMGLDDTTWPTRPKPNPFIPLSLQKKLNMPNASSERELNYCQELTLQFQRNGKEVIFSYPELSEDRELRPSSLIKNFPFLTEETLSLSDFVSPAEKIFLSKELETITYDPAPPIELKSLLYGGVSIFKKQAECPFKAFVELRLHAKSISDTTLGLKPLDRGNLIHKTLELIWQKLNDSAQLKLLTDDELKKLIHLASKKAMQIFHFSSEKNKRYLALELKRLKHLMWNWLMVEKNRPPFKVIASECEVHATINHITISMRIDRIDQLEDGMDLIIDYKTGKYNDYKKWFGERPDEPQLPLYCITSHNASSGIAFAQIHPSEMELKGISKMATKLKSIKMLEEIKYADAKNWDEQIQKWQNNLTKLADDFYHGKADIDPKDRNITCRNCDLHPLCRIDELQAEIADTLYDE